MASAIDRLARTLVRMHSQVAGSNTTPQLQASAIVDGALDIVSLVDTGEVDESGDPILAEVLQAQLGAQEDGSQTLVVLDGPEPPVPVGLSVATEAGTLTAVWPGGFADGVSATLDHDHVAIHVAEKALVDAGGVIFPSDASTAGTIRSLLGGRVTFAGTPGTAYYVGLVEVTQAGKWSALSDVETVVVASVLDDAALAERLALAATMYVQDEAPVAPPPGSWWWTKTAPLTLSYTEDGVAWVTKQVDADQFLAARSIIAELLAVNAVQAENIATDAILARHIKTGEMAADKIGAGELSSEISVTGRLTVVDSEGVAQTVLAPEGSVFRGDVESGNTTVTGRLLITSDANGVGQGGALTLFSEVPTPDVKPSVVNTWPYVYLSSSTRGVCSDPDGPGWIIMRSDSGSAKATFYTRDANGSYDGTVYPPVLAPAFSTVSYGVGVAGGDAWVWTKVGTSLILRSSSGRTITAATDAGADAVGLGIGEHPESGCLTVAYRALYSTAMYVDYIKKLDTNPATPTLTAITSNLTSYSRFTLNASQAWMAVDISPAGYGINRLFTTQGARIRVHGVTAQASVVDSFPTPSLPFSVGYRDGAFWTATDGRLNFHTSDTPPSGGYIGFAYALRDDKALGTGRHETYLSPWATAGDRCHWVVRTPDFTPGSGVDDVDSVAIYSAIVSGTPPTPITTPVRQAVSTSAAVEIGDLSSTDTPTGAVSIPFPSGNPARIRNREGTLIIDATGRGEFVEAFIGDRRLTAFKGCKGSITASHDLATNYTKIGGYTTEWDTDGMLNASSGTITAPASFTGIWAISAAMMFATNTSGRRFIQIEKGTAVPGNSANTVLIRQEMSPAAGYAACAVYTEVRLDPGEKIFLSGFQTSGGTLAARGDFSPTVFSARLVAELS